MLWCMHLLTGTVVIDRTAQHARPGQGIETFRRPTLRSTRKLEAPGPKADIELGTVVGIGQNLRSLRAPIAHTVT